MIKLKNIINEAGDQWQVKDIIEMQKAHEKIIRSVASFHKVLTKFSQLNDKNKRKPNGRIFDAEATKMITSFEKAIYDNRSPFWKSWEEYKKGGKAAFPNNWN